MLRPYDPRIIVRFYRALRYYGFRPLEALELALKGWAGGMRDA